MGCTGSKINPQEKEASQRNARIERQLRQDRKADSRTVKILLLGTGHDWRNPDSDGTDNFF